VEKLQGFGNFQILVNVEIEMVSPEMTGLHQDPTDIKPARIDKYPTHNILDSKNTSLVRFSLNLVMPFFR